MHPSARPAGHGITIGTPRLYDLSSALLVGRRRAFRRLLAVAQVQPGDRVLDIGCGPGYFARMLAAAVDPNGLVIGIDAAPEMTEYAIRKSRHLSNCRFQPGTAEKLDFPEALFDLVTSTLMMHHLPDEARLQAVQEMRRVLRPGGTLLIADFHIPDRGLWRLAALVHHARAMEKRVAPLEPLIEQAGLAQVQSGDAPPWLHYVRATRP